MFCCCILHQVSYLRFCVCVAAMPSVMERSGAGVLSRSRAKTVTNGNSQPHSEEESSDEEHAHGRHTHTHDHVSFTSEDITLISLSELKK